MRLRILLAQTADAPLLPPGDTTFSDNVQAAVDAWLVAEHPCLCLPRGVCAIVFDQDTGAVLGRVG